MTVQVPYVSVESAAIGQPKISLLKVFPLAVIDFIKGLIGYGEPLRVPLVGKPGDVALFTSAQSQDYLKVLLEPDQDVSSVWTHKAYFPARVFMSMLIWRPCFNASRIKASVLVLAGERDEQIAEWSIKLCTRPIPNLQYERLPGCGHFDIFEGGKCYEQSLKIQTDFLKNKLGI